MDNDYPSDDDTIYPTNKTNDKKPRQKSLSDELIDESDDYMDDIIAGLHKQ